MALSKELQKLYPEELYIERVPAIGNSKEIEVYASTDVNELEEDTVAALYKRVAVYKIRHITSVVAEKLDE